MNKTEIKAAVYEAIELLIEAQPGRGTATTRAQKRNMAGEQLSHLPHRWWKKFSETESDRILQTLAALS